jgi:hypothetical protein
MPDGQEDMKSLLTKLQRLLKLQANQEYEERSARSGQE